MVNSEASLGHHLFQVPIQDDLAFEIAPLERAG
jgi:hypothetical protein